MRLRFWLATMTLAGWLRAPWSVRLWLIGRAGGAVDYDQEPEPRLEDRPF